jgi:hypothetical protein
MGRASSAKNRPGGPATPSGQSAGLTPILVGAVIVAIVGIGVFAFWPGSERATSAASATTAADAATQTPKTAADLWKEPTKESVDATEATAKIGPHKQASLPPIPFRGYAPPRPPEVVAAAFQFAAEHPEITSYVPCFCGCQQAGHKGNHDCFVKSRAANGDVTEWEEHGVECAVCIDVATRSRQLLASGASVRDIRAAIEKEFASAQTITPTPKPPAPHSH